MDHAVTIRNKEHAWRVLEYQRQQAIANWDKEIAQWLRAKRQCPKTSNGNGLDSNDTSLNTARNAKPTVENGG